MIASIAGLGWTLWRRPPSYLLLTYGFGYSALSFITFLRYSTEWKERRFEFPLDFGAILLAVLLIKWLPQRRIGLRWAAWSVAAVGVVGVQALWVPIQGAYTSTEPLFQYEVGLGRAIGHIYDRPEYRGGVLTMPGDEPTLLYVMVRDERVPGNRITSQFYDPFYYLPAAYDYRDHADVVGPLLHCWLSNTKTRLLLLSPEGPSSKSVPEYIDFIADHPQWFSDPGAQLGNGWGIVAVQVPDPGTAVCAHAAQAAQAAPH